ncbi:uncharacterized protein BDZ99DRAFT_150755 [Mytilinidion resinicola]|uniref:Uncharacterized protein n=1 Tax=Mytilinidion resinicola TaxID=574789 RepID=A0A6A6Y7A8_9PEZI|nr:uncharacterized protein BDZ99DRAFT_150755 [Mytilinidion resinicola]KAF2804706.1 hypothetical protein BDZ99DRAFT_150755 [Mytilinidion resinicola]
MLNLTSPVSGPSAFGVLPALALNVMLQPCGSVCGFHPRLRTYMRSSPFICFADSLAITLRFCVYLFYDMSPRQAARAILALKFRRLDDAELDGLQALEKQAWIRLLGFVAGLLPQSVKIFACGGVRWTQAVVGVYLASFSLVEVLKLLAGDSDSTDDMASTAQVTTDETRKKLTKADWLLAIIAVLAQSALIAWTSHQVFYSTFSQQPESYNFSPGLAVLMACILFIPPFLVIAAIGGCLGGIDALSGYYSWFMLLWYFGLSAINMADIMMGHKNGEKYIKMIFKAVPVTNEILFLGAMVVAIYLVASSLVFFNFGRTKVLFLEESAQSSTDVERRSALRVFVLAVITTSITMAWYFTRYDGTGTTKPYWTNWLG